MFAPTSRCALAVTGLILGSAQVALGQTADTIKRLDAINPVLVRRATATPSAEEQAAAQHLAAALSKAGITVPSQDVNSLAQAIAQGGSAAMALAMMLVSSFAELDLEKPTAPTKAPVVRDPTGAAQKQGDPEQASLSPAQIDGLIARLPPDTTLKLTRYLKYKLTQFRNSKPPQ